MKFLDVFGLLIGRRQQDQLFKPIIGDSKVDDTVPGEFLPVRLFLHPAVKRKIKSLAIELDCRPHDLLLEGVDLMLRKYGQAMTTERSAEPANEVDPDVADRRRRLQKIAGKLRRLTEGEPSEQNRELGSAIKPSPASPCYMFVPGLFER